MFSTSQVDNYILRSQDGNMTEYEMALYEREMAQMGYSVIYHGRKRIFRDADRYEIVWERVNAKWAKISG